MMWKILMTTLYIIGNMRRYTLHTRMMQVLVMVAMCLTACSREEIKTGPFDILFSTRMQNAVTVSRADTYQDLRNHFSKTEIGIYVASEDNTIAESRKVGYNSGTYTSALKLENGTYRCYGYMPSDVYPNANLDFATNTLTISDVPAVSTTPLTAALPEEFTIYNAPEKINLQMNQLMGKVTLRFLLPSPYADLRQIEITNVRVTTPGDTSNCTATVEYDDAGFSTQWISVDGAEQAYSTVKYTGVQQSIGYPSQKALRLTTTAQEYGACYLVPGTEAILQLEVTYNVYDMTGSETRHERKAVNSSVRVVKRGTPNLYTIEQGNNYVLNITVLPSYLYALSDFDHNNPHIKLD